MLKSMTDDIPYKYPLSQPPPTTPSPSHPRSQKVYLGTGIPVPLFRGAGIEDLGFGIAVVAPDCRLANVETKLGAAIVPFVTPTLLIVGLVIVSE